MKAGLQEINETVGVWGSLLCTNQGEIIENLSPPTLTKPTLENIARHVVELLSGTAERLAGLEEAVFHYQDRKVLVIDLQQVVLIVICTPSVDIPLLRMSVNVVVSRWKSDPAVQKDFKKNFVERI
jgi:predicted regulator of Ras-like GTPase activity (Roadblock/LC7/MglB family)